MTRKKKTRSLKRIHSVKTGTPSKIKRDSTTDLQASLKTRGKPKSVYQKYLDENPDAVEKQQQPISPEQEAAALAVEKAKLEALELLKAKSKKKSKPRKSDREVPVEKEEEKDNEREPDLLGQLDNKNFNDFY
jgi:hypothetical protein